MLNRWGATHSSQVLAPVEKCVMPNGIWRADRWTNGKFIIASYLKSQTFLPNCIRCTFGCECQINSRTTERSIAIICKEISIETTKPWKYQLGWLRFREDKLRGISSGPVKIWSRTKLLISYSHICRAHSIGDCSEVKCEAEDFPRCGGTSPLAAMVDSDLIVGQKTDSIWMWIGRNDPQTGEILTIDCRKSCYESKTNPTLKSHLL